MRPASHRAPIYRGGGRSKMPAGANAGLWYTRFFDRFTGDWKVDDDAKRGWIGTVEGRRGDAEAIRRAVLRRLEAGDRLGWVTRAFSTRWHFATGLGLPHPVENGFAWHPTLGVPYLCGAAVKGLVRAWIECWADLEDGEREERMQRWFGSQDCAGRLIFFDALPGSPPDLGPDVMTPHMGKWYEKGGSIGDPRKARAKEILPADWHSPVPVHFLVVRSASFLFTIAPRRRADAADAELAMEALRDALKHLGAGAKTATGYGRMKLDPRKTEAAKEILSRRRAEQEAARAAAARAKALEEMDPFERSLEEIVEERGHGGLAKALQAGTFEGDEARRAATKARELMIAAKKWKPKSHKKNPDKDWDYQRTLAVMRWLEGD